MLVHNAEVNVARTNCEFAGTLCRVRTRSIITVRTVQAKRKVQAAHIHIHFVSCNSPRRPVRPWGPSKGYSNEVSPDTSARTMSDKNEKTGAVSEWRYHRSPPMLLFLNTSFDCVLPISSKSVVKTYPFLNDTPSLSLSHTHIHTHTHTYSRRLASFFYWTGLVWISVMCLYSLM
jgi:hypothetical protein